MGVRGDMEGGGGGGARERREREGGKEEGLSVYQGEREGRVTGERRIPPDTRIKQHPMSVKAEKIMVRGACGRHWS